MDVMRSLPKKSRKLATESQQAQRQKFSLTAKFLSHASPVLRLYYGQPEGVQSRRDLAMAYHINEALTGTYPNIGIDFTKVVFTKGELAGIVDAQCAACGSASLQVNWSDNSGDPLATQDDQLLAFAYNPTTKSLEYRIAVPRTAGSYAMTLPAAWNGQTVHCWISFVSQGQEKASNSLYMGTVLLE